VFDPLSQYKDHSSFSLVTSKPSELHQHVAKNLKGNFRVLYQVKDATVIGHWRQVAVIAYAAGDLDLCIDEIGFQCRDGNFIPDCRGDESMLYKLIHFGRHRNIRVIATAQLPKNMATNYRALSDEFRLFQTVEPDHLSYLAERIGKKTAETLTTLPKYAFVYWRANGEVVLVKPKGSTNAKGTQADLDRGRGGVGGALRV
jgi:hypothetical protein